MAKTIEIPDVARDQLLEKARVAGLSLEQYVTRELEKREGQLSVAELWAWIRHLPPIESDVPTADILREAREERDRDLDNALRRD